MRIQVVDLADERDAGPVHDAAEEMPDGRAAFPPGVEAPEAGALDDGEGREDRGQLALPRELRPVMADHQQDGGAEEQDPERAEREGEGTGVGAFLRVTVQDAFPLAGIDEAIGVPGGGFLGQPFTETGLRNQAPASNPRTSIREQIPVHSWLVSCDVS